MTKHLDLVEAGFLQVYLWDVKWRIRVGCVHYISLEGKPQEPYSWEVKLAVCSIFKTFVIAINILQHDLIASETPQMKEKEEK